MDAYDIYLIAQHIIQNAVLENGYQIIAADANKSGTISNWDIQLLRKLLKPAIFELPDHDQPFRFVPEFVPQNFAAQFNANPFNMGGVFPSTNNLNCTLLTEATNFATAQITPLTWEFPDGSPQNFDAIKVGDVDGSWESGCDLIAVGPSEVSVINPPSGGLATDQEVLLSFKAKDFTEAKAFSFGINIPKTHFEVLEIQSNTLADLDPVESFGTDALGDGKVSVIWYETVQTGRTLPDGATLFSIKVKTKQPISDIGSLITFDNAITKNKIWQGQTNRPAQIALVLEPVAGDRTQNTDFSTIQQANTLVCLPNPTTGTFQVRIQHDFAPTTASIGVFSLSGQLLREQNIIVHKGENLIEVDALVELPAGTYHVQLATATRTLSATVIRQ